MVGLSFSTTGRFLSLKVAPGARAPLPVRHWEEFPVRQVKTIALEHFFYFGFFFFFFNLTASPHMKNTALVWKTLHVFHIITSAKFFK